jgi:4-hydroxy-tetrahydrodipicolinate reductase
MKENLRLAVLGASGRMGQAIGLCQNVLMSERLSLKIGFAEKPGVPGYETICGTSHTKALGDIDVLLDFSVPGALFSFLTSQTNLPANFACISGVTGLDPHENAQLIRLSARFPILWSANFSLQIQWLLHCLELAPKDIATRFSVHEVHHIFKKDSPSGTALRIKEALVGLQKSAQIEIKSERVADAVGTHRVLMESTFEKIQIEHQAMSRQVFAEGALRMVRRIHKLPPKLYNMRELLWPIR